MSELKVINAYIPTFDADHNVMLLVSHTKENYAPAKQIECYLKSEADKVIAELKNEIEKQKRLRDMALASVPNVLKVMKIIQHQKHKRCMAMRNMCRYAQYWYSYLMEYESCKIRPNNIDFRKYNKKYHFYIRWRKRWLELAEEPTWAKFLQLIHKEAK